MASPRIPSVFDTLLNGFTENLFLIGSIIVSLILYILLIKTKENSESKIILKVFFSIFFILSFFQMFYKFYSLIKAPSYSFSLNYLYLNLFIFTILLISIIVSSIFINSKESTSDTKYISWIFLSISLIGLLLFIYLNFKKIYPYIFQLGSYIFQFLSYIFTFISSFFTASYEILLDYFKYLFEFMTNNFLKIILLSLVIILISLLIVYLKVPGKIKEVLLGSLIFIIGISIIGFGFNKLYDEKNIMISGSSLKYYIVIGIGLLMAIGMLITLFYTKEMLEGNFRNYGMLLFDIVLLGAFLFIIYKFYNKFLVSPEQSKEMPTLNKNFNDILVYDYLFPTIFLLIYVLYYFLIYKKEGLTYTDYSDYRVIIYNVLTFVIIFYLFYQLIKNFFSNASPSVSFLGHLFNTIPCILWEFISYLMKDPYYGFVSIGSSIMFIYFILASLGIVYFNYNDWKTILTYIFLIIIGLTLLFKMLIVNTGISENKYFKLLSHTIFAIPCLILVGLSKSNLGTPAEYLLLVLLILGIILYEFLIGTIFPALFNKYLVKDGKQIIHEPITLSKYNVITNTIENSEKIYDYKYGASFWLYVDSFPIMTNKTYNVCCLGDGLKVSYNPLINTLFFSYNGEEKINIINQEKMTEENLKEWNKYKKNNKKLKEKNKNKNKNMKVENNSEIGDVLIYKYSNLLLQKWNNIIINYSSGTLDIFINGSLVKSKINVAPYVENTSITIGSENGISGHICNLVYYPSPLNSNNINIIYNTFKERNPPIVNKNKLDYLQVAETLKANFNSIFIKKDNKSNKDEEEY